ncbi:MAG: deoxynucleoside kinase [Candidatus Magasanikbacteria bacterium]
MFIIIDGIDGSGKSTVFKMWAEYLQEQGKKVFDLKTYWNEHHKHPEAEELMEYDVILSSEPTTVWTGAAIRQEMIQNGKDYSPLSLANAYSLDRHVLYKRVLVPLLDAGKIILQDRSVSTSICYQSTQKNGLSMDTIANLEGNAFALEHAPDHFVIANLPAEEAMRRLGKRSEKQDNAIFEKTEFLEKVQQKYLSPEYQKYFLDRGTTLHIFDADKDIESMKLEARKWIEQIL